MCLAIPMKVKKINGQFAWVKAGGLVRRVNIQMVPTVKVNDFIIVHAGFAIEIIDTDAARQTLSLIYEVK